MHYVCGVVVNSVCLFLQLKRIRSLRASYKGLFRFHLGFTCILYMNVIPVLAEMCSCYGSYCITIISRLVFIFSSYFCNHYTDQLVKSNKQ